MSPLRLVALSFLALTSAACVVDGDAPPRTSPPPAYQGPAAGDPPATTSPSNGTAPMLVEIDTDQTMTADPGQGVGVFIEYGKGGQWNVWWTCDTAKTQKTCDFSVGLSVAAGKIADVDASAIGDGVAKSPSPTRLDVTTTTSSQVHGVSFVTNPGAVLTVSATVSGLRDGSFLFFVQDGKVNGGFTGVLTNPLQLQGKTP